MPYHLLRTKILLAVTLLLKKTNKTLKGRKDAGGDE